MHWGLRTWLLMQNGAASTGCSMAPPVRMLPALRQAKAKRFMIAPVMLMDFGGQVWIAIVMPIPRALSDCSDDPKLRCCWHDICEKPNRRSNSSLADNPRTRFQT